MNVKVENETKKEKVLELGDVVHIHSGESSDGMYFVVTEGCDKYILRRFDIYGDWLGYDGTYSSLEKLTKSISCEDYTTYPREEYELILRKIEE